MSRLTFSLFTTVIGMLVVFVGLVILIACIYLMTGITGRKKKVSPAPVNQAPPAPAPAVKEEVKEAEDDGAVVAAISAAVAMILAGEHKNGGFVVRRIRRVPAANARARAAREEQIFSRL